MKIIIGAFLALTLAAGQAQAQTSLPAEDLRDMQCLTLAAMVAGAAPAEHQAGLTGGLMYYLGRLEGRTPGVDWLARIGEYLQRPDVETEVMAQGDRCAAEMIDKGQSLAQWGERLKDKAAPQGD